MALPAHEHVKLLRVPLLISGVILVLFLVGALALHWLKPAKEPERPRMPRTVRVVQW